MSDDDPCVRFATFQTESGEKTIRCELNDDRADAMRRMRDMGETGKLEFKQWRMMIPSSPTVEQRAKWEELGYREAEMTALAQEYRRYPASRTSLAADIILDYVHAKGYTKERLDYQNWDSSSDYVWATDAIGRLYLVIGSYWQGYVLRGVLRKRNRKGRFCYWSNGQASTNSIQIALISEQDSVPFPELDQAKANYIKAMEAYGNRPKPPSIFQK